MKEGYEKNSKSERLTHRMTKTHGVPNLTEGLREVTGDDYHLLLYTHTLIL